MPKLLFTDPLKTFNQNFVRHYQSPYALQLPGKTWITVHRSLSDPIIEAHLEGKFWVAARSGWYPEFYILDFDYQKELAINRRIALALDILELEENCYYLMTSPSHFLDGSCHLILRLHYRGAAPAHALGFAYLKTKLAHLCEIYPQTKRKFRLPLGLRQHLIKDGQILSFLSWQEAMHFILKLDSFEIPANKIQNLSNELIFSDAQNNNLMNEHQNPEIEFILQSGLVSSATRHDTQWRVIVYFFRNHWSAEKAAEAAKTWIRRYHNGFSKEAAAGNWKAIDGEIDRQTDWIYSKSKTADKNQAERFAITADDLKFIARVYPADAVNQKRLFNLIGYCRPLNHHDWIFIPYTRWEKIAHKKHYHQFIENLAAKNLLKPDWKYQHRPARRDESFCRKFRLLFALAPGAIVTNGHNKPVENFYAAWLLVCRGAVDRAVEQTGIPRQRFYAYLNSQKSNPVSK